MQDFLEIVPIGHILERSGVEWMGLGFEDVYASLATDPNQSSLLEELDSAVYEYFDTLSLPTEATLYDALILSLRGKDVIATFNWDPFLILALRRNSSLEVSLPHLWIPAQAVETVVPDLRKGLPGFLPTGDMAGATVASEIDSVRHHLCLLRAINGRGGDVPDERGLGQLAVAPVGADRVCRPQRRGGPFAELGSLRLAGAP